LQRLFRDDYFTYQPLNKIKLGKSLNEHRQLAHYCQASSSTGAFSTSSSRNEKLLRPVNLKFSKISFEFWIFLNLTWLPVERHHATKVIISPEDENPRANAKPWQATMDAKLIKALGRAVYWQHLIDTGRVANMTELSRAEGMDKVRVHKILKLARLSPAIAERVACAKGPVGLSFEFFMRKQRQTVGRSKRPYSRVYPRSSNRLSSPPLSPNTMPAKPHR
jgi:hypothetical protein